MNGLHDEMRCVLITHDFSDLESLADKSMFEGQKWRMNSQEGSSNQKPRTFPLAPRPTYRPPPQTNFAPRPFTGPSRPSCPNRPTNNTRLGGSFNNQNRGPNVVCFECGTKGHYSKECPNPKRNVPRPNAPAPNRVGPVKNTAPCGNAAVAKGRLNHINIEEALEAPDVVLGTFLVNSVPATVLFDSGATHSFVMREFMTKGGLVGGLLPKPMVIQTPGSTANAQTYCHDIPSLSKEKPSYQTLLT